MRSFLIYTVLLAMLLLNSRLATADSPITSTNFSNAYTHVKMVKKAAKEGIMSKEIAVFLLSDNNAIDVKAAVVNALSWDIGGKRNALVFWGYMAKAHKTSKKKLKLDQLSADELLCYGYLLALDDYNAVTNAVAVLNMAKKQNPKSYTVNIILAIVTGQSMFTSSWCVIWKLAENVQNNTVLNQDMNDEAIGIIFDYLEAYADECP